MARKPFNNEDYLRQLPSGQWFYSLPALEESKKAFRGIARLPYPMKVVLENRLRNGAQPRELIEIIHAPYRQPKSKAKRREILLKFARILMQDFTGVPAIVDLAAMRDAMVAMGGNPEKINPLSPVDLVIDHSVNLDASGSPEAFRQNLIKEYERNGSRYAFLRWGQNSFDNFRIVPPGTGICHQVNLEYLSQVVWQEPWNDGVLVYPDTVIGLDSHTPMINALGVLGWGVGGIEAEAAMLGLPVSMLVPDCVGFELTEELTTGVTPTALVLKITEMLRKHGVVGKFVQFYGSGVKSLSLADRAVISNMAADYGATCAIFAPDAETENYLRFTAREVQAGLLHQYMKAQGMLVEAGSPEPVFNEKLSLDLSTVQEGMAGPKRPEQWQALDQVAKLFKEQYLQELGGVEGRKIPVAGADYELEDGAVLIAAVTSCTNTSNPSVMVGAGLVARKARELGLTVKPWVKTSLAPGSQVVEDYLQAAGLLDDLNALGFNVAARGCTTCIGQSGPLAEPISEAVGAKGENMVAGAVLSGNRNFEGRVSPQTKANYLAAPPLVVAYAIAGNLKIDVTSEPIAQDAGGNDVFLRDIWPTADELRKAMSHISPEMYRSRYANAFDGDEQWQQVPVTQSATYDWQEGDTYIQNPPFFRVVDGKLQNDGQGQNIRGARLLALLGDKITTDHISPAGAIQEDDPAGQYLTVNNVVKADFNKFGARRGAFEVLSRGTFANIRLQNEMVPGSNGSFTIGPDGTQMSIFDAAMAHKTNGTPTIIIAGKEYGTGSSRDWAAKGPKILGVKAVVAESFERIHRSNLLGMGVLPLQFQDGVTRETLRLRGDESFDILVPDLVPGQLIPMVIERQDGSTEMVHLISRLDTESEVEYYLAGGILHYALLQAAA